MAARKVPLNIFGMGFGLVGLATTWRIATEVDLAQHWIADSIVVVAALVWGLSLLAYLRYVFGERGAFSRDLTDMTAGPFASLAVITPLLCAAEGVAPYWPRTGAVLVDVFIALVVLLGGWYTGFWMRGGTDIDRLHPGYFRPTVAGGLVASACATDVGQVRLAQVMFGLGLICWAILGSMILGRLFFRPALPDALVPTMAIELAPAAVASVAYLSAHGGKIDLFAAILAGYGLLMVIAQLPLLPKYFRLKFSLGTWAFTFSWAAVASTALFWIHTGHFTGSDLLSYLVLAAITILLGSVSVKTVAALGRGTLIAAKGFTAAPSSESVALTNR